MRKLELQSGKEVTLTINYGALLKLKNERPEDYRRYNYAFNNMGNKEEDKVFLMLDIVYTAYLCGRVIQGNVDGAMGYEEFLFDLPDDTVDIMEIATTLISKKKLAGLGSLSKTPQKALKRK